MLNKTIKLSKQEELKIFMSPQRQKLLRLMRIKGEAATAKTIADMLNISTSSAQFHIRKLEKIGLVELDHTELINGILAKYFKLADVNVSIGSDFKDNLKNERYTIMQNLIKGTFDGLIDFYETEIEDEEKAKYSRFINGFINLTQEEAQELLRIIDEFIESHDKGNPNTQVWEGTLMLYKTETKKKTNPKA